MFDARFRISKPFCTLCCFMIGNCVIWWWKIETIPTRFNLITTGVDCILGRVIMLHNINFISESALDMAYNLLTIVLPPTCYASSSLNIASFCNMRSLILTTPLKYLFLPETRTKSAQLLLWWTTDLTHSINI